MEAQEMLDRYVHAVSRYLPARQRDDVAAELRSLLHDTLETPSEREEDLPDIRRAADLIREMGNPEIVALRYLPTRSLIGPALYPSFITYTRLMLAVLAALFVAVCAYSLWSLPAPLPEALVRVLTTAWPFIGSAVASVGIIVITFGVIERIVALSPTPAAAWDPYALPAVRDPDQIKRRDMWGNIAARLLLIAFLNFFPNLLAFVFVGDSPWGSWPQFTPEFRANFGPWFTGLWVLEAGLFALVLRQGRWRPVTRWLEVAVNAATVVLLCFVVPGGAIVSPSFIDAFVKFGLTVTVIVAGVVTVTLAYKALRLPAGPLPSIPGLRSGDGR